MSMIKILVKYPELQINTTANLTKFQKSIIYVTAINNNIMHKLTVE